MPKVKNTSGKAASKVTLQERTIKKPAKAGTLKSSEVLKVIKKVAAIRNGITSNS